MWDDYHAQGFDALAIDLGESNNTVKTYARQYHQTFLLDAGMSVWAQYEINGYIPLNYVIDTAGVVLYGAEGFDETVIRAYIEYSLPPTGVAERNAGKVLTNLSAVPNPACGPARVAFTLAKPGNVTARVYSSTGKLVKTLLNGRASAGSNAATWNLNDDSGSPVANGLYFCQVSSGNTIERVSVSVVR